MADQKAPASIAPAAVFSNVARIRHTQYEFFIDFAQLSLDQPGMANAVSCVVMTPNHAMALRDALSQNIEKYESIHGKIAAPKPEIGTVQ